MPSSMARLVSPNMAEMGKKGSICSPDVTLISE